MDPIRPILILSEQLDYHGVAVRWALRQQGIPLEWWDRTEFPRDQQIAAWVSNERVRLQVSSAPVSASPGRYRTIWNRRGQVPQVSAALERTDRVVARNESTYCLAGLASVLADANPHALIVNAFDAAKAANTKLHQLNVARAAGFRVPDTLLSNDPQAIRQFFAQRGGRVVAKHHIPFAWRTRAGKLLVTGTSALAEEHLSSDEALSACPMLYQEMLDVESELRVIAFGHSDFALEQIRTAAPAASGFVDIRYEPARKQAAVLEAPVRALCREYMARMRLSYAAFDIVKTVQGDYVFLEANEAGQFLFLENEAPELPMLDAFCQFLSSGDAAFRYEFPTGLKLADFENSADAADFHRRYDAHMAGAELTSPFELTE